MYRKDDNTHKSPSFFHCFKVAFNWRDCYQKKTKSSRWSKERVVMENAWQVHGISVTFMAGSEPVVIIFLQDGWISFCTSGTATAWLRNLMQTMVEKKTAIQVTRLSASPKSAQHALCSQTLIPSIQWVHDGNAYKEKKSRANVSLCFFLIKQVTHWTWV